MAITEGILTGLSLALLVGPVMFTLVQASLKFGFKGGMAVALGIIVSDIVAVVICFYGASKFFEDVDNQLMIAIAGGLILLVLGIKYLLKPSLYTPDDFRLGTKDFGNLFTKGFLVNFVNPFVFIVWVGLIGYATEKHSEDTQLYLGMVLLGIFFTDSLKAYFAGRLSPLLSPKRLKTIYQIIGILLLIFGIRLLIHAYVLA